MATAGTAGGTGLLREEVLSELPTREGEERELGERVVEVNDDARERVPVGEVKEEVCGRVPRREGEMREVNDDVRERVPKVGR